MKMIMRIKNNLYRTRRYWLTKKWIDDRPVFSFWKGMYRGSYGINKFKNYKDILLPTLTSFGGAVIYSIFIIFILELLNNYYPVNIGYQKEAIDTFLSVVASISGVFLGLYFTAISGIASSYLLRAPQNVKQFFLTEPRGQQYVRTIAITGIVSVFYIVFKSFDQTIHPAGLGFLSLLVAYIVIRFWQVGTNVFYSLEPQFALPWITRDILFSMKNIAPPGFQWNTPAIQNHHRGLASSKFALIKNLVRFGKNEMKISDEQLITSMGYIGGLLFSYADFKKKTPTQSYWFETKNEFQDWGLASSSEIAIALSTGTSLQPKNVRNYTWYEDEVLNIAAEVFSSFADSTRVISSARALDVLVDVAEIYAQDFDTKSAELLFKKTKPVRDRLFMIQANDVKQPLFKEQLAFVDAQGRLATSALLGLVKYLDANSCESVAKRIADIKWLSGKKHVYLTGLPGSMLPRLESLQNDLENEKTIEGELLTADWYIKAFCFQQYLFSLQNYFNFIKSLHTDHFQSCLDGLLSSQQLPLAVHLVQRWKEYSVKYRRLVFELKKHVECSNKNRLLGDLPWVDFDFEKEEKLALGRENDVTDKMIQLLPQLTKLVVTDGLPDYFGQALTEGIQACYDACEENDPERLKKILPAVFSASLSAYDRLREKVKDWSQLDSQVAFVGEPLENLFEISGYAKLYAELYQSPEIWNVFKNLWNTYFAAVDAKKVIEMIAAITRYRDSLFTIMPQATLRTNWQIVFENKLREQGIPVFPDNRSYDSVNGRRQPTHTSPIIRVLERSGGLRLMASARDVFFATYLSNLPAAAGIELPDRHNFKESIQEEQQNPNQEIEDDE
ncbi:MAG: hypothetical protein WCG28_00545 [bacterium]